MYFEQIFEEKLAQYAYLIGCQATGEAIIIDPMRDINRYIDKAKKHNLNIVAAAETHIHADYLSGMRECAEAGIPVYVSDEGNKDWKYEWVLNSIYKHKLLKDGDEFSIGNIRFKVLFSPGHTPEHIAFLVSDGATTDEPMGILSGDFVFVGDVGRPDLLETAAGQVGAMEESAKVLYKSLQKFNSLPHYLQVWPGHGAGSACGKALGAVPDSTVGYELRFNASIKAAASEESFVEYILDGQPEPPLYFARMKRDNKLGPKVLGNIPNPKKLDAQTFRDYLQNPEVQIVDTRPKSDYLANHVKGAIYAPVNKQFNTIVGSYVEDTAKVVLIAEENKIEEAVLDLVRIGIDCVTGYITPDDFSSARIFSDKMAAIKEINFNDVDELINDADKMILDVRKKTEFDEGHFPEALNVSHTRIMARIDEIPMDKTLLVHCKSGARASAAISVLEREGRSVLYVNDVVEPWLQKKGYLKDSKQSI